MHRAVVATALATFFPASLLAQDCPTARDGKRGFVVERGASQKSEVFHAGDGIVRTVMRYDGKTMLETTLFEGLLSLERIEGSRRMVRSPKTNLAALFPLKPGRKVVALFELTDYSGKKTPSTIVLAVKNAEPLFIGPCKYTVLKVDESESRSEQAPRLISTNYYSPELKLVLQREYERSGRTSLVKYDKLYPIK